MQICTTLRDNVLYACLNMNFQKTQWSTIYYTAYTSDKHTKLCMTVIYDKIAGPCKLWECTRRNNKTGWLGDGLTKFEKNRNAGRSSESTEGVK